MNFLKYVFKGKLKDGGCILYNSSNSAIVTFQGRTFEEVDEGKINVLKHERSRPNVHKINSAGFSGPLTVLEA